MGIRRLPWLKVADKREPLVFSDCRTCMKRTTKVERQFYGCGYEPAAPDGALVQVWTPPDGKYGYDTRDGEEHGTCPGYLTSLPQIREVWRAHSHWEKGALGLLHPAPSDALMLAIEHLDSELARARVWEQVPENKGGGAQ